MSACAERVLRHDDADLGTAQRVSPGASASSSQACKGPCAFERELLP